MITILAKTQIHLSEQDIERAIKCIITAMTNELASGGRVEIRGFGSFSLRYRKPRMARNPHFGNSDDRMSIDDNVTVLNPLKNPVGKDKYSVLEVTGTIYKGTYRMRLIYGKAGNECVWLDKKF